MTMIPNRKNRIPWVASLLMLAVAMPGIAQKDFNMEEKQMIRDYKRSNTHFLAGAKLYGKNKVSKALSALEKCLEIYPEHDKANFLLADIYLKKRDLPKAEKHILAAKNGFEKLQKWYSFTFQQYLESLREQKNINDQQIAGLEASKSTATGLQKSRIEGRLAQLKSQNQEADTKLSDFLRSGTKMPANYHYIHGNVLFLSRRFRQAMNEYTLTVEQDPKNGGAFNNMANIYFMMKLYDKARENLTKAEACGIKINPKFREALEKAEKQ